jgi:hypothetical protein
MKSFLTFSILATISFSALAYENTDITNANSLASQNIVVDQSQNPEKYRLDDKILRQEVIGMALKVK